MANEVIVFLGFALSVLALVALTLCNRDKRRDSDEIKDLKDRLTKLEEASMKRLPPWLIENDENHLAVLANAIIANERTQEYNASVMKLVQKYLNRGRFGDADQEQYDFGELLRKINSHYEGLNQS